MSILRGLENEPIVGEVLVCRNNIGIIEGLVVMVRLRLMELKLMMLKQEKNRKVTNFSKSRR